MAKVLFAWELGGNLGHLAHQVLIARILRERGHECLFAVRDCAAAGVVLGADRFEYVQAPYDVDLQRTDQVLTSYADILEVNGYATPERLESLVGEWQALYGRCHPDAVVVEYAPTAVLAAKLANVQIMRIDTGFGFPPFEIPYPCFRPWLKVPAGEILAREQRLLGHVNQLCRKYLRPPFTSLQQALTTDLDLLVSVPELDHYPGRQHGLYVGPLFGLDDGDPVAWSEAGSHKRVLLYLRPCDWLPVVLDTLVSRQLEVIAVIPGCDDGMMARYSGDRFRISRTPVLMADLLPKAHVVITQGGHGVASACLMAGVPMLIIPQMIEQLMTARNIEQLGMGLTVVQDEVATGIEPALDRLLKEPAFRDHATVYAGRYAGYDQTKVLLNLADTVEAVTRRAHGAVPCSNNNHDLARSGALPLL